MKRSFSFLLLTIVSFFSIAQVPGINMVQFATGYDSPVDIKSCGDNRLFIVEQDGYIHILYKDGTKQTTPFLNIDALVNSSGNEQGLLSLAFSPSYKQDGYFYVNYIYGSGSGSTRISRFSVMANDSTQADPGSEEVLLTFTQPYTNHKGATLMFGKDGYLYDSQGDGGSGGDPQGNGQNKNSFLGKMLRLDVSNPDTTYTVPSTNPFVGQANTKPEIWAYGLRNPWRCSFDRLTGDMWIGDVGQDAYEEIDFQSVNSAGGENYGWRCREGLHPYNTTGCPSTGFTDPIFETAQVGTICSITGGYVYRGAQYSKLFGLYLHSDFCNGRIWSTKNLGNNTFDTDSPLVYVNGVSTFLTNNIGTFGQDDLGELYIAGRANGRIYRLTETTNCNPVAFISLKDTIEGCNPVTVSALRGDSLSYQWYDVNGVIGGTASYQYAAQQSGWYRVKVSKTLNAGCEAMSDSVYVLVRDTTAITSGTGSQVFCENASPVTLGSYLNPTGGVYSGAGVSNNVFTPSLQPAGTQLIQYVYSNQYGCVSHSEVLMQVNDTTALVKNNLDSVYCITDGAFSLNGFYNFPGTFSGNGMANDDSTFSPASAGVGLTPVQYSFTDIDGCQSTSAFNLEVGDKTPITKTIPTVDYCDDAAAFDISSFVSPTGGVFSGSSVTGTMFNPAAASAGTHMINYSYTNNYGCVSEDSFGLNVVVCSGISELKDEFSFTIFPNPSKGNFNLNVQVTSTQQAELLVTDAVGKVCYRKNQLLEPGKPVMAVELPALAKGNYTVQLKTGKGSAVKSLVIE